MFSQGHVLAAYPTERKFVPTLQKGGWAAGPVRTGAGNLAPTGIRSLGRPVSRHMDYAFPIQFTYKHAFGSCFPKIRKMASYMRIHRLYLIHDNIKHYSRIKSNKLK